MHDLFKAVNQPTIGSFEPTHCNKHHILLDFEVELIEATNILIDISADGLVWGDALRHGSVSHRGLSFKAPRHSGKTRKATGGAIHRGGRCSEGPRIGSRGQPSLVTVVVVNKVEMASMPNA